MASREFAICANNADSRHNMFQLAVPVSQAQPFHLRLFRFARVVCINPNPREVGLLSEMHEQPLLVTNNHIGPLVAVHIARIKLRANATRVINQHR